MKFIYPYNIVVTKIIKIKSKIFSLIEIVEYLEYLEHLMFSIDFN